MDYENLRDPNFGVVELAAERHVSEATLRQRLAEQAKFTPAAFIRHWRLEQARKLVGLGNMLSVAELAHTVGFSGQSYFARLYEKTFNCKVDLRSPKN